MSKFNVSLERFLFIEIVENYGYELNAGFILHADTRKFETLKNEKKKNIDTNRKLSFKNFLDPLKPPMLGDCITT